MRGLATTLRAPGGQGCVSARRGLAAAPRRVEVELTPQAVTRIAAQVAQLLESREEGSDKKLISAGELALRLGVERPWIYRHRHLLGGIRMGAGPKARWRFDFEEAISSLRHAQMNDVEGDQT